MASIAVPSLPATPDDFLALRNSLASTPEGGAAALLTALVLYAQHATPGRQCLIIQSAPALLSPGGGAGSYQGYDFGSSMKFLLGQLDAKKYVPASYVQGTSPANGYALPAPPYNFSFTSSQTNPDGSVKVFVACSGADSPRPITLVKNDKGHWKASEYSSLFVGVRPPVSPGPAGGDF